ncbi:MAG: hypothetical protein L0G87_00340 [Renibacterium salmoninarum]|nr:hypothetical protein [Renibacterium salmoninarum]
MTQLDFMHARAAEMLRAASPLQHSPWIARLVGDVVEMCAEVAATDPNVLSEQEISWLDEHDDDRCGAADGSRTIICPDCASYSE